MLVQVKTCKQCTVNLISYNKNLKIIQYGWCRKEALSSKVLRVFEHEKEVKVSNKYANKLHDTTGTKQTHQRFTLRKYTVKIYILKAMFLCMYVCMFTLPDANKTNSLGEFNSFRNSKGTTIFNHYTYIPSLDDHIKYCQHPWKVHCLKTKRMHLQILHVHNFLFSYQ